MTSIAQALGGQNHDRFSHDASPSPPSMAASTTGEGGDPVEITMVQKMLSATSGSLLTGLLGKQPTLALLHRPLANSTGSQ